MQRTNRRILLALAAFLPVLYGCKAYTPKPIDWDREAQSGQTNALNITRLDDAATIALIGSPELNQMRLKAANSSRAARESGWWEDPELDFDVMRIINPSENPFLGGGSVTFTIPLSGALALEEKSLSCYALADKTRITAAEYDVAAQAKKLIIRLNALRAKGRMLKKFNADEQIKRARESAMKLHDAGEISSSELAGVKRRKHILRHEIMENEAQEKKTSLAFLELAGLRPETQIDINLDNDRKFETPPEKTNPLDLVKHPSVAAKLAALGATEHQLHAEIRRQYPDLKLGPGYVNEEGLDRLGLVAGITLPLWNRNRMAIAEAEGLRDLARLDAVNTWRSLVYEYERARSNLTQLLEHPPTPAVERHQIDRLSSAGELTPIEYLAEREEILEFELAHVNWLCEVQMADVELKKFTAKINP